MVTVTVFKHPALKQLTDQQVRFAPPVRRLEQLARARQLLAEIEPGKAYPYQFVCYRITEYRPDSYPDLLIGGADLAHDLACMIAALGGAVPAPEATDPIVTLEELSRRLNVSTKTLRRWREFGLVGRRVFRDGKHQVGYPEAVVARFLASHPERVQRGSRFSQMSDAEREEILRRAKRLVRARGSLTEVSRRIARRLGRSVETVRYTLKNYDRE